MSNKTKKIIGASGITRTIQDWTNFKFFTCDDETRAQTEALLQEREYLLSSGMPNREKIAEEAEYFASSLAERYSRRKTNAYGLAGIANDLLRLYQIPDMSALYFYISNLYGKVYWRTPYNLQRLPVCPDALNIYLGVFTKVFIEKVREINDENEETGPEYEAQYDAE